MKVEMQQGGCL